MNTCKCWIVLSFAAALSVLVGCGSTATSDPPNSQLLPAPGSVSATSHPLVASYSVTMPSAGAASVEFGTSTSYGRSTIAQTASSGGGTVTVLVAGMRPNMTYHMRARLDLADGTTMFDADHTFTTGSLPQVSFPAVTVTPPGLAQEWWRRSGLGYIFQRKCRCFRHGWLRHLVLLRSVVGG